MKQKERIDKMEKILNNSTKLLEELEEILNKLDEDSKNYNELVKYYYSKNWAKDKEDFEKDLLPDVEAAGVLDSTENHILALTHIVDRIPAIVAKLTTELPEQLEDLESGYRKLLDANYQFVETDIESRLQLLYEALKNNHENLRKLELDNAEYENAQIQEEINALYDIFTREIASEKAFEKLISTLPTYLGHLKENNEVLVKDMERLGKTYLLSESDVNRVRRLQADITAMSTTVEEMTSEQSEVTEPYSILKERLENLQTTLKDIEDDQITYQHTYGQHYRIEEDWFVFLLEHKNSIIYTKGDG